jgi:hypothetical protein
MNVKVALKEKNRLVKEINDCYQKMLIYNSIDVSNTRPYSSRELMDRVIELTDNLITLKTKINIANLPVYGKIFRLSELKNAITKIKNMDCTEGASVYYSGIRETQPIKTSEISIIERDDMVRSMETEINEIQDYLDNHNHNTLIS